MFSVGEGGGAKINFTHFQTPPPLPGNYCTVPKTSYETWDDVLNNVVEERNDSSGS